LIKEVITELQYGALVSTSAVICTTAGRRKKTATKMKEVEDCALVGL
jgi:hypothetical protein